MGYDIFLSYRRDGGADKARILQTELTRRGYKVFLDFDELKDGIFDERIMKAIETSPVFMILLSENALDRCCNEDDWVRKEVEYAIKTDRHIIPINPDCAFRVFPKNTPPLIAKEIGQHQMSEIMFGQLFSVSIDKMIKERIDPALENKRNTKYFFRKNWIVGVVVCVVVVIFALLSYTLLVDKVDPLQNPEHSTVPVDNYSDPKTPQQSSPAEETSAKVAPKKSLPLKTEQQPLQSHAEVSKGAIKAEIECLIKEKFEIFKSKYSKGESFYNMQAYQSDIVKLYEDIRQITEDMVNKHNPNNQTELYWIETYCDKIKSEQYSEWNKYLMQKTQLQQNTQTVVEEFRIEIFEILNNTFNTYYYDVVPDTTYKGIDKKYLELRDKASKAAQPLVDKTLAKYTKIAPDKVKLFEQCVVEMLIAVLREHNEKMGMYELMYGKDS